MTDDQLLADFISHRDADAFAVLVRRYGPMVFRVSRDILGNPEDAEDAFQATFAVLVQQAGSIRQRSSLGRWLYKVACRISRRKRLRIAKRRSQERRLPAMEAEASPDLHAMDHELKFVLHEEIGRLPGKLRDPIVLCYFEGLTAEDAARRLCCPVDTLKSRLGKGREVLRSRLTSRGLAVSTLVSLKQEGSAALPRERVDFAVNAGLEVDRASKKVSSIVFEGETRRRKARMVVSRSLMLALLMIFGASGLALAIFTARPPAAPGAFAPARSVVTPQFTVRQCCRAR